MTYTIGSLLRELYAMGWKVDIDKCLDGSYVTCRRSIESTSVDPISLYQALPPEARAVVDRVRAIGWRVFAYKTRHPGIGDLVVTSEPTRFTPAEIAQLWDSVTVMEPER